MIGGVVANPDVLEGAEKNRQPSARNELARRGLDERARGGIKGVPQSLPPLAKESGNEAIGKTNVSRPLLLRKFRIDKPRLPNR